MYSQMIGQAYCDTPPVPGMVCFKLTILTLNCVCMLGVVCVVGEFSGGSSIKFLCMRCCVFY